MFYPTVILASSPPSVTPKPSVTRACEFNGSLVPSPQVEQNTNANIGTVLDGEAVNTSLLKITVSCFVLTCHNCNYYTTGISAGVSAVVIIILTAVLVSVIVFMIYWCHYRPQGKSHMLPTCIPRE